MFEGLAEALGELSTWTLLIFFLIGVANGMTTGLLPGLGGSVGIALMIPLTYGASLTEAMVLFVAAMSGQTFSGSIGAILLNIPGSAPAAATALDGYPLAKQGRGGFAIGISASASVLGTIVGCLLILLLFPVVRYLLLSFGYPEFTMLGVLGLTAIALASRGSLFKGLISGALGFVVSMVGYSPIGNQLRFTFGETSLWAGISLVAVLIGVFAIAEVAQLLGQKDAIAANAPRIERQRDVYAGVWYAVKQPWLVMRSSLLGTGIGAVPGLGGVVAAFLAYFQAQKSVKNQKFGQGDPRGVVAPEASAQAKEAGAALPSLAFGIPGSAEWAIVLGAMIIHGANPGPQLAQDRPSLIWVVIIVIAAGSLVVSLLGVFSATQLVKLTRVRPGILGPIVAALALVGAYSLDFRVFDVFVAVAFGLIGYLMVRNAMPVVPLILGLVLGDSVESWYLRSLALYDNGHLVFVTRPISLILVVITVGLILSEVFAARKRKRKAESVEHVDIQTMRIRPSGIALFASVGLVGLFVVQQATTFSDPADKFPLYAGGLLLLGAIIFFAVVYTPALKLRFWTMFGEGTFFPPAEEVGAVDDVSEPARVPAEPPVVADGAPAATEAAATRTAVQTHPQRLLDRAGGWLAYAKTPEPLAVIAQVLFAIAIAVLGLLVAVPLFLIWGVWVFGRESWRTIVMVTVITSAVLYIGFHQLLGVPVYHGIFG